MIQCPICQVVNEDTALFCAECGQRFGPAASEPSRPQSAPPLTALQGAAQGAPQAQPLSSPVEQEPKQKRIKLHSPMLGGADDPAEDEGYSKPQLSRLRGTASGGGGRPAAPPQASEGRTTGGRKHLRSPLLGGADDDFDDEEEPVTRSKPAPRKTGGGGLRSPLLGESGGDFDDDEDEPPAPRSASGKKTKLRSPLLGDEDDDDDDYTPAQRGRKPRPSGAADAPRSSSPTGGLRSPLLGGGDEPPSPPMAHKGRSTGGLRSPLLKGADDFDYDDDDDEPQRPSPNRAPKQAGGRPKLHSPILGDSDSYYDDDEDEDEDDDGNPDVLRSPLLAAKKKRSAHPAQAPGQQQMQAPPAPGQMPGGPPPGGMPHPTAYNPTQPQGQSGYGAPPAVPPAQPPTDLLVANQPPLPGQLPPNYSQQGMQPGMPQQGMPPGGPQPPGMPPGLSQQGMPGMPAPPAMPPTMLQGSAPQSPPNFDFGAPQAISQSGVQRSPAPAAPPPAEPREQAKLVSHTASSSDVPSLPSGDDEKYAGLADLNKQIDKKEEQSQIGPADRRGIDRRKGGRDRRLTSPLVDGGRRFDDDSDTDSLPTQKSGGSVPMVVPVLIGVGLLCKGVFFQQVLPTNTLGQLPWYFWVDQAGTGVALFLCLIIVVMSGGKK